MQTQGDINRIFAKSKELFVKEQNIRINKCSSAGKKMNAFYTARKLNSLGQYVSTWIILQNMLRGNKTSSRDIVHMIRFTYNSKVGKKMTICKYLTYVVSISSKYTKGIFTTYTYYIC